MAKVAKVARRFLTVSTSRAMVGAQGRRRWRRSGGVVVDVVDVAEDVEEVVMVGGDSGAGEGEARLNGKARLRLRLTDGREGGWAEEAGQVERLGSEDE